MYEDCRTKDYEAEEYQLCIYNNKIDIEININFCPMCGFEL